MLAFLIVPPLKFQLPVLASSTKFPPALSIVPTRFTVVVPVRVILPASLNVPPRFSVDALMLIVPLLVQFKPFRERTPPVVADMVLPAAFVVGQLIVIFAPLATDMVPWLFRNDVDPSKMNSPPA